MTSLNTTSMDPNIFQLNLRRNYEADEGNDFQNLSQKSSVALRNIQTAEQLQKRKSPKKLDQETQIEKWRLEMTSE